MEVDKIVQFKLLKNDFKKVNIDIEYQMIHLTKLNYTNYWRDLLHVINLISNDLKWDGIPNKDDIINRFNNNSECFLWIYDNIVVGWGWFNKDITLDWINIYQKLNENGLYAGGAFVSKKIKTPTDSGFKFYNYSMDLFLNKFNYDVVYLYSDSWNRASAQLSYKCGFKKYNFLNDKKSSIKITTNF